MDITRLTTYIIVTRNDIVISQGEPEGNGKYMVWVTLGEEDRWTQCKT